MWVWLLVGCDCVNAEFMVKMIYADTAEKFNCIRDVVREAFQRDSGGMILQQVF